MTAPKFFVVARVVGRDGGMELWKERLVHLCGVSATESYGDTYYWGQDLDGEPDTLWGLEGYTHPIGFFIDHVSSDIFKREMALVDQDELLQTKQGLGSPDYDLHHYDQFAGFLKRADDPDRDSRSGHVVVYHFWAQDEKKRADVLETLTRLSEELLGAGSRAQSALVLKECRDTTMATLWLRFKSREDWDSLRQSGPVKDVLQGLEADCLRTEIHNSESFNGHLGLKD